jgi:hypothetical protein
MTKAQDADAYARRLDTYPLAHIGAGEGADPADVGQPTPMAGRLAEPDPNSLEGVKLALRRLSENTDLFDLGQTRSGPQR